VKHTIRSALALFIIAGAVMAALGVTHALTREAAAGQEAKQRAKVMGQVLPSASEFAAVEADNFPDFVVAAHEGFAGGVSVGFVVEVLPHGYGGPIDMMVGISSGEPGFITGVRILRHSETPGLGALAVKERFRSQFAGKELIELTVVKGSPREDEIDAIAGSTITSKAVTNGVNIAVRWYSENSERIGG
jgi:electron transport complex protein RnfG